MKAGLSISLRLTLWFSGIFLCGIVIFGAFIWFDLSRSLGTGRDKTLARRAERLVELIEHTQMDSMPVLQTRYEEFVDATPEGSLVQLYSLGGEPILYPADSADTKFSWPRVPDSQAVYRCDRWYNGQPYRVFVRSTVLYGQPVRIFVAGQLSDNRALLGRLAGTLWRSIPPMILLSALAGYFISRRALKPVVSLTESARSISIGNLEARLPVSPNRDELAKLAETCNEMLSRLEEAVKAITRFTADASHELRSPIAIIRTTCDYTLRTPGLDSETAQAFESITKETEHCLRLLEDLLLLARSDAERAQLTFEPVYISEIMHESVARMRLLAQQKQQRLDEKTVDEDLKINGDPGMLGRLICILLDNAIKYTRCGGHIEVSLTVDHSSVVLAVVDNGIGIPAAALPHIFERFYRVDPSRGEHCGTGLGLAIAKWIVDAHGAQMIVDSTERAGTTFSVAFPADGRVKPGKYSFELTAATN